MTRSITYVGYRITERCNKNCPFCFAREKDIASDQSLEEIELFLKNLKRAGIKAIGIMGGEPLIREDIIDILRLVKRYQFESILSTNATLLSSSLLKKISPLVDFISISLDADGKEKNNKFRGLGQFEAAKKIIKIYDPKVHKFRLKVNTVVHKQNLKDIDNIPKLFNNKPIIWKLLQYTPRLEGKKVKDRFALSLKIFKQKAKELKKKFSRAKIATRTYEINEKYDLLILRPNGNLEINHREEYKVVGNAKRDEIRDVINKVWNCEETYYKENWDEFKESYR